MTENGFACLQRAVNLARFDQYSNVKALIGRLEREKWPDEDIKDAIGLWSQYEKDKKK